MPAAPPAPEPPVLVEHYFRHEYGRLVATLVRRFGTAHMESIEDAVQGALTLALSSWALRGMPDNPGAWLQSVAFRQVVDALRRKRVAEAAKDTLQQEAARSSEPPDALLQGEVRDAELRMLFVCCHSELNQQTQLVLALKLLCGFSVREIARRLLQSDEAIQKRFARGREQLKTLTVSLDSPNAEALRQRLPSVHQVLYLLFNEGYSSARPDEPIRRELCAEAVRLCQQLTQHAVGEHPDTWALLALMHFHHARLDARSGPDGSLLLLDEQDRSLYRRDEILLGFQCLARSGTSAALSRYQLEAAILSEHCAAPTYDSTDWESIVHIYEALERLAPSPLYTLNRAVALAEWQGPDAALSLLRDLTPPAWLFRYYLWDATLGELLRRSGRFTDAIRHLDRAIELAPTDAERAHFVRRRAQCKTALGG